MARSVRLYVLLDVLICSRRAFGAPANNAIHPPALGHAPVLRVSVISLLPLPFEATRFVAPG
jgi:hypothetical protein